MVLQMTLWSHGPSLRLVRLEQNQMRLKGDKPYYPMVASSAEAQALGLTERSQFCRLCSGHVGRA